MTIRPALQQRFITGADSAFPASPTSVHTLHAAHSPFLSMPGEVANIVVKLCRAQPRQQPPLTPAWANRRASTVGSR